MNAAQRLSQEQLLTSSLYITTWRSITATQGDESALTWPALEAMLSTPAPRPVDVTKPKLGGWSAARFEEHRRLKERVQCVTALVLDLDSGDLELADLRGAFAGRSAIVHNTRSSQPGAQCWRVVVALSRPVAPGEHATVWAAERDRLAVLGVILDEQTKDPSRLWFVPCEPLEGPFLSEALSGDAIDVDAILAAAAELPLARVRSTSASSGLTLPVSKPATASDPAWMRSISTSTRKRRAAAWLERAEIAIEGQGGSNVAMRVATAVVRGFALDRSSALEVLASWNLRCDPPWSNAELAHKVDEADRVGAMTWGAKLEDVAAPARRAPTALDEDDLATSEDDPAEPIRIDVDLGRVVDEAVEALTADASIYQRDGQLVHVVRVPETEADALTLAGAPQIRALASATLRERLARVATWEKYDGRKSAWKPATPTVDVVSAVASRGMWKGVRPIVGIIEAPSLRPDGSVIQAFGHDAATGFVLVPSDEFPKVPDAPSLDDARRALAALSEPLADFPYPSEAHRAVTLSAILTVVARPAIRGAVPAFIFDASTPGSGKTLQADVVSLIATGRVSGGMGFPVDDEELEKVLGSYALRGSLLVNFDNLTRSFGGGPLDKVLTATDTVDLRVLGKSEVATLRWRATVLATGNNVEVTGDTVRRVLFSRLEPGEERPEDRTDFRIGDLRAWVRANRSRLVVAALTILRAYVVAGRPNAGSRPWGSFEAWTALVPAALVWAGAADATSTRPASDGSVEPTKAALMTVLDAWPRLAGGDGITAKRIVQLLYPGGREPERGNGPPDGFDDVREALEHLSGAQHGKAPSPMRVGVAFRRAKGRNIRGLQLEGVTDRNGVLRWSVASAQTPESGYRGASAQTSLDLAPEGAGDAGDEGRVSTQGNENVEIKYTSYGPTAGTSPASPASPAVGSAPPELRPIAPGTAADLEADADEDAFDDILDEGGR